MKKIIIAFVVAIAFTALMVFWALGISGQGKPKVVADVLSSVKSPNEQYAASLIEIEKGKVWNVVVYEVGTDPKTLAVSDCLAFPKGLSYATAYRWLEPAILQIDVRTKAMIDAAVDHVGPIRLVFKVTP